MITSLFSKQKAIIILSIFWVGQLSAQLIFTDIAAQNNTQDFGAGFASAWGDYNNDGFMDLYISMSIALLICNSKRICRNFRQAMCKFRQKMIFFRKNALITDEMLLFM